MKKHLNYGIALSLLLLPASVMAASWTWVNWQADQDWSNPGNWAPDGLTVPTATDQVHINQGLGVPGPIVSSNSAATGRIVMDNGSSLTIAAGGSLVNSGQHLAGNGSGSVNNDTTVSGTYSVATEFGLGAANGGAGSLTVNSGGTVTSTGGWIISGWQGGSTGEILVDGGTLTANFLHVGWSGDGVLRLTNSASVTSAGAMNIAVDPTATGLVEVNGGVLTVAGLNAGNIDGSATITLNGGQLINSEGFVQNTNAIFNLNGGELIFTSSTLDGVNAAIDSGGGTWNFAEFRSVVSNAQGIVVSSIAIPPTEAATIVSSSVSNNIIRMVIDTPSGVNLYYPMVSSNLAVGAWGSIPHSDDGVNAFVVTNLDYSTTDASGTNEVIYVQADHVQKFFIVEGEQP